MKEDLRAQLQRMLDGAYTIERELGGGGMSRVFTATESRLNRRVVVKALSPECTAGVSAERFQREIQFVAALQQANIVPLLSAGSAGGLSYFTMPFVEGESLRGRLAKGPLSIAEVTSILRDVARALSYAHRRGVVHRDIKPDNVLLSQGTAVVTDFGIAKALSESCTDRDNVTLTQLGMSIGTPAYMAPEQAAGETHLDHRADLYAFGCLAYELLTGRPPFHGRTPTATLAAHIGSRAELVSVLRPDTPPGLADLVMKCLAKDASDRPQSADDMMRVFDEVPGGGTCPAPSPLMLGRALTIYAAVTIAVAVLARTATNWIGLPEWVFLGAVIVMALTLPAVLWTGYVQHIRGRARTGPPAVAVGSTAATTEGRIAAIALQATPLSWRQTTRGTVIALGAFTAVVAGDVVMRTNGLGPFASLLASGELNPDKSVLVSEFASPSTDSSLGLTVAEGVRMGLSASDAIHVMTQGEIAAALERMKQPASSRVDFATAREIAAREEVTAIVDGEVASVGTGYVVRIRLVTADSGRVLFAEQRAARGPLELIEGVDALTRALRGRIGESLKRVNAAPALARVTTTSLEALRWYTRGVIAGNREGDFAKSADFHRRAVAEDSTFAEAWRTLGTMYYNIGASRARRDSALARAYQFRERLPRLAQNNIAASYFYAGPGRDRGKAIAIYEAMCDDGDTAIAANNLAVFLIQRREYATAESLASWRLRTDPQMVQARIQLIFSQFQQGKLASAESTAVAGLSEAPVASARWRGELALMRYAKGDLAGALNALDSLPDSFRSYRSFRNGPAGPTSGIAAVQGRLITARSLHAQAGAITSRRSSSPTPPLRDSIAFGLIDLIVGSRDQAIARLDAALSAGWLQEGAPSDRPYLQVATFYAQAGRADRAREVLRERRLHVRDTSLIRAEDADEHRVLGEIALAEQRGRDAVAEFWRSDSLPDGPSSSCLRCTYALVARAHDLAGESDSAIVYLERYLATPDLDAAASLYAPDPLYLAPAHERLGQLYQARGDIAKSVAHYRTFLELWKHADPELQPRVAEARRRMATIARVERMQ